MEWALGAPYLQAGGTVLALLLGAANLAWLIVQARRSAATHRLAAEAHDWARQRRDAEEAAAQAQQRKREFFTEVKQRLDATTAYDIDIPQGTDPAWLAEGEALHYFRVVGGTFDNPGPFLARWAPRSR